VFIATGTYRIERGEDTNDYGDGVDIPKQVFERIPLALTEKVRRQAGADNFTRERIVLGRGRPGVNISEGDRLFSEQTNEQFVVTVVNRDDGVPVMASDTTFECSRTTPDRKVAL